MKVTCTFVVVLALLGCASASDHKKAHHKRQEPGSDQALYGGHKRSSNMDGESDAALFRNMKAHNAQRSHQTRVGFGKDESDRALYGRHRGEQQSDKALYGHGSFIQAKKKRQEPESDAALYGNAKEDQESDAALYRKLAAKRAHHEQHRQVRSGVDESDNALYGGHRSEQESDQALYGGYSFVQVDQEPESDAALYGKRQENQESDAALYRNLATRNSHQQPLAIREKDESDLALYGRGLRGADQSDKALYGSSLIQVQKKVAPTKGHLPIGVGAYQDPKAVEQRTKDDNKDCEDGKWNDCHSTYGDYGDSKKPPRSGATHAAVSFGLVALVLATMQ